MFKFQKTEKKKLIIYIIIITAMLAGIGFFIYKNYSLTAQNNPENPDGIFTANEAKSSETANGKSDNFLDINIFNDPKFRALQDNSIVPTSKVNIGRENPFEPY